MRDVAARTGPGGMPSSALNESVKAAAGVFTSGLP